MGIFDQIIIRILGLPGPRWEVAGNEMGRRIYHRRWDVKDGKWQVMRWECEFAT